MLEIISEKTLQENPQLVSFVYSDVRQSHISLSRPNDLIKIMSEFGATFKGRIPFEVLIYELAGLNVKMIYNAHSKDPVLRFIFNNIPFYIYIERNIIFCPLSNVKDIKLLFAKIHKKYRDTKIYELVTPRQSFDIISDFAKTMYLNKETIDELLESIRPYLATYERRARYSINMNLSVILTGKPGDGKTYSCTRIIEKIARVYNINIVREESNTFALTDVCSNFVALLDDMNLAHFQRNGPHAVICQKILSEMDQTGTNRLFFLTTNEEITRQNIDRAFFRPGRVQNIINVNRPNTSVKNRIIDNAAKVLKDADDITLDANFVAGLKLLSSEQELSLAEMMRLKNLIFTDIIVEDAIKKPAEYIRLCQAVTPKDAISLIDSEQITF